MGGGGSKSSTTTNLKTKAAIDFMVNNIMNCSSNSTTIQRFVLSGNYNSITNFKMVQSMKLSSECAQSSENISDLQQNVANAIKQAAESQSVSVLGALGTSKAQVNSFIDNEVSQKITNQTVQNIVNNTNAQQEVIISGNNNIVNNFAMEQTMDLVFKNCQDALNKLQSVQAVETKVDQSGKATQTNFVSDIIGSIFSGLTGLVGLWLIFAVIMACIGAFVVVKMGGIGVVFGKIKEMFADDVEEVKVK